MKKYIFLSLSFLIFVSCNYKEEETFEQKASERTVNSLNSYKKTLENDSYWLLTYYPEQYRVGYWVYPYQPEVFATDKDFPKAHRSIGGYNFLIKLKDGQVTASSEASYTNDEETSYFSYDITEGPTISFDTFNSVLHHFRFVSSSFPNARGGETDFIVLKYENDTFTLRGRTSNNIMTLKKFTGDRETYLNKIRNLFDKGEVKQAVAEYLDNIVNESVNEEIQNYNLRAEVILYFNVVIMNEEIKEDLLKISNGAKLEDTWIAKKIQKETEKDKDFLSKMVN